MNLLTRHILYFSCLIISTLALAAFFAHQQSTAHGFEKVMLLGVVGFLWSVAYMAIDPFRILRDRYFSVSSAQPTTPTKLPSSFGDHTDSTF